MSENGGAFGGTIDAVYAAMMAGIISDPPWQDFVDSLRAYFNASHANIIFRGDGSHQMFMAQSNAPEVARFGDLAGYYDAALDPIPYFQMEAFRAFAVTEFAANEMGAEHPFITQFLRPLGMESLLICRVKTPTKLQAWISITRNGVAGFTPAEHAIQETLARAFAHALAIFGQLKLAQDERDAYVRLVHARAAAMVRFDKNGDVLNMDTKAQVWVEEGRIIQLAGARLRAMDALDDARLSAAIARILHGDSEEEFLVLSSNDSESLEVLLFPVSEPFDPAWTHSPRVIAYLGMTGREALPSPQRLRIRFGLTRREAALAILLTKGLSLSEAAADLGISEQTGRAYLRQIFQKAGVKRQADLVRSVLGSIGAVI